MRIPLRQFPALCALKNRDDFLPALRAHHPERVDFLNTASLAILRQVFQTRDPRRVLPDEFDNIIRLGYSAQDIADACAIAFFDGVDELRLIPKGYRYRYLRIHHLVLYAITLAVLTVFLMIELAPKSQSGVVAALLVFEPLLAFIGVGFSTLYFYLLKLIFKVN